MLLYQPFVYNVKDRIKGTSNHSKKTHSGFRIFWKVINICLHSYNITWSIEFQFLSENSMQYCLVNQVMYTSMYGRNLTNRLVTSCSNYKLIVRKQQHKKLNHEHYNYTMYSGASYFNSVSPEDAYHEHPVYVILCVVSSN